MLHSAHCYPLLPNSTITQARCVVTGSSIETNKTVYHPSSKTCFHSWELRYVLALAIAPPASWRIIYRSWFTLCGKQERCKIWRTLGKVREPVKKKLNGNIKSLKVFWEPTCSFWLALAEGGGFGLVYRLQKKRLEGQIHTFTYNLSPCDLERVSSWHSLDICWQLSLWWWVLLGPDAGSSPARQSATHSPGSPRPSPVPLSADWRSSSTIFNTKYHFWVN